MTSTTNRGTSSSGWEPPSPQDLQRMLPQYEITGILGHGGMGAVYRGRQPRLDREVAIKVLPENLTQVGNDDLKFTERFELEAQAMAKFCHPSIVAVFDFGETSEGQLYFVMEFVEGMDIHQYLNHHGGALPQEHALSITAHVLDALEYAHARGIVHRDIKPANILLNNEGQVKIADFGLAKILPEGKDSELPALTMTNMAMDTPDFIAPEALDGDVLPDHRADLYAVGVMLYQMLTGKLPRGQFKLPGDMIPELDPRIDEIVDKSLQYDPEERFSTASEMRFALDPVITSPMSRLKQKENDTLVTQAQTLAQNTEIVPSSSSLKRIYLLIAAALFAIVGIVVSQMDWKRKAEKSSSGEAKATPFITPDPSESFSNEPSAARPELATKELPFENSLGMRFVPVPITGGPSDSQRVLFSIWETRVVDYAKFVSEDESRIWLKPESDQDDYHPATFVNGDDATTFCEWLTAKGQSNGELREDECYRLPSDHEWSCAVGIGKDELPEAEPLEKSDKIPSAYPWGGEWPPTGSVGNYYGAETDGNPIVGHRIPIEGFSDGFDRLAKVGSFTPNKYGLFDLGGNVWELCDDLVATTLPVQVLRGASFGNPEQRVLNSSFRGRSVPGTAGASGFRCVIAKVVE